MKLEYIEYVAQIANYHSINKAAKALYFSQPFLSGVLRQLEDELGYALFKRSSQGVVLTEEGEEFLKLGRQVQVLVTQMETIGNRVGHDRILHICYTHSYHVLDVLQSFINSSDKNIILDSREVNNPSVYFIVKNNPEYIGIAYRYGVQYDKWLPFCENNNMEFIEFYREPVYVVIGHENPLYNREYLTYEDLKEYEAVMQKNWTDNEKYQIVMPDFMQEHFKLSGLTFDDSHSKHYFISKSPHYFGISVKWFSQGDPLMQNGAVRYIPLRDDEVDRRVGIVLNKQGKGEKTAKLLYNYFREQERGNTSDITKWL